MTTVERVWLMPAIEVAAHARAYGLTGKWELAELIAAAAEHMEADEARALVRPRRRVVEVKL